MGGFNPNVLYACPGLGLEIVLYAAPMDLAPYPIPRYPTPRQPINPLPIPPADGLSEFLKALEIPPDSGTRPQAHRGAGSRSRFSQGQEGTKEGQEVALTKRFHGRLHA